MHLSLDIGLRRTVAYAELLLSSWVIQRYLVEAPSSLLNPPLFLFALALAHFFPFLEA